MATTSGSSGLGISEQQPSGIFSQDFPFFFLCQRKTAEIPKAALLGFPRKIGSEEDLVDSVTPDQGNDFIRRKDGKVGRIGGVQIYFPSKEVFFHLVEDMIPAEVGGDNDHPREIIENLGDPLLESPGSLREDSWVSKIRRHERGK